MRFLLDENIGVTITKTLKDAGFDVVHIRERKLLGAPDEKILNVAFIEERIMDTKFLRRAL